MNWIIRKSGLPLLVICFGLTNQLNGQVIPVDFVYGGVTDAEKILQAYLEPYANILGSDLNAGWYNTARPHKLGGLDVTATVSWAKAPSSLFTFDVAALGLTGTPVSGSAAQSPTVAGEIDNRPTLEYAHTVELPNGSEQTFTYASFELPNGTGIDFFPLPMGQLSVGLPFGTDVSARFVPMIRIGDFGEIGLWGVGGKHSISQWLPGIKEVKMLDIAVQGGYTSVTSSAFVTVKPLEMDGLVIPSGPVYNWDDQYVEMEVEGWTVNLIASQTLLKFFTVYEGIGYANSLAGIELEGHFPIPWIVESSSDPTEIGKPTYIVEENPISLNYENLKNLRLNVGARIKLGVLTLHYDFTHTLYSTHSVGVGVSFR